jgi:hypothetical protein
MLDLTGHMIIWGGLFAHGDGSTGLMKFVFCYALPMVVQGFGANETLHFRTTTFWAQLLLGVGVLRWLIFRPIKSHTCSIGFMSGDIAAHGIV